MLFINIFRLVREKLKAANIDISGRFLTSNATSKEGQQLTAYLTGENLTLTGIFTQRQDEVHCFRKLQGCCINFL